MRLENGNLCKNRTKSCFTEAAAVARGAHRVIEICALWFDEHVFTHAKTRVSERIERRKLFSSALAIGCGRWPRHPICSDIDRTPGGIHRDQDPIAKLRYGGRNGT